jgi:hypothetical protein
MNYKTAACKLDSPLTPNKQKGMREMIGTWWPLSFPPGCIVLGDMLRGFFILMGRKKIK